SLAHIEFETDKRIKHALRHSHTHNPAHRVLCLGCVFGKDRLGLRLGNAVRESLTWQQAMPVPDRGYPFIVGIHASPEAFKAFNKCQTCFAEHHVLNMAQLDKARLFRHDFTDRGTGCERADYAQHARLASMPLMLCAEGKSPCAGAHCGCYRNVYLRCER